MSFKVKMKNLYLKLLFRFLLQIIYFFGIAYIVLENVPPKDVAHLCRFQRNSFHGFLSPPGTVS